ncbi:MAG: hypothetical protein DRJ01_12780 [Bacteroidetes bacterium]|nr:MAG: hypothetical protein DRJ01_12780 [Bacteroidota bacterium]
MSNIINLININKRKGFPRVYRFNFFLRWFTLTFGTAAVIYSIWLILFKTYTDTSNFKKFIPFIILFFAANSVMKNLFSLNSILFTEGFIKFRYLARKSVSIRWDTLKKMIMNKSRQKSIKLFYVENGIEKSFIFTISFPNMLEIVNSIAEMCPHIEFDEFMKNVVVSDMEKRQARLDSTKSSKKEMNIQSENNKKN